MVCGYFKAFPPLGQNAPVEHFEARFDALSASVLGKVAAATHEVLVPLGEGRRMRVRGANT